MLLAWVGEGFTAFNAFISLFFFFFFFFPPFFRLKELAAINDETLLSRIEEVLDERVKPVKGKIGMQRQRFRAIKSGVDLMLDVCRQTHSDLETEMEGKYKIVYPSLNHSSVGIIHFPGRRCTIDSINILYTVTEYVEELSQKYQMPLTLANTAQRGYHLQQTVGQPKKKGETSYIPPPSPQLPSVFVCVSFFVFVFVFFVFCCFFSSLIHHK